MNTTTHFSRARVAICAALFIGAASANASSLDFGEMEVGVTYSFNQFDEVTASYTAPASGPVKFVFIGHEVPGYSDAQHNQPNYNRTFTYGAQGEFVSTYNLAAGETLYLYSALNATLNSGSITIAAKPQSLNMVRTSPSADPADPNSFGEKFSVSTYYRISFYFDEPVTATSGTLRFADGSYVSIPVAASNSLVEATLNERLMEAYHEGKISDGDEVTVRIVGIRCADFEDVRYNGNGRLDFSFKVAAKPVELVSSENLPTTGMPRMMSYYLPEDPDARISLTFDGELDPSRRPSVQLAYGNVDDMENPIYLEYPHVAVNGSSLSADLSGKRRRPVDMIPGISDANPSIGVTFSDLYSLDGQRVYTGIQSSYSYMAYVYPISVLEYVIASDFTPVRDSSIKAGQPMEMWIMNGDKVSFEDIRVDYLVDGSLSSQVIPASALNVAPDPESPSDLLVTFDMPDINADLGSEVTISLDEPLFADGLDHTANVKGSFVWSVSGAVDSVGAPSEARGDVFSISGVKVLENASRRDVANLPAGLYIFNGRKIAVTR